MKDAPDGTHVALEGKYSGRADLVAIDYQHNSKVALYFIIVKNAGSARQGKLCKMKFSNTYGNAHSCLVDRPSIIFDFFERSNCADKHI